MSYLLILTRKFRRALLALMVVVSSSSLASPQDGVPVQGWGNHPTEGASYSIFATYSSTVTHDMIMLADGSSILSVDHPDVNEYSTLGLVRLDPKGLPVSGFGIGGYATTGLKANSVSGRIKAGADGNLFALRTVDNGAKVCRFAVATGLPKPFPAIQNACITIPDHFGMNLALQPDGKLLVLSYDFFGQFNKNTPVGGNHSNGIGLPNTKLHVLRFNGDGSPDITYGKSGMATISPGTVELSVFFPAPVVLTSNNKLVLSMRGEDRSYLYRLTDNGIVDASWSPATPTPGAVNYSYNEILAEPRVGSTEDDIVLLGLDATHESEFIARLRGTTGERDTSFGTEAGFTPLLDVENMANSRLVRRSGGGYFATMYAVKKNPPSDPEDALTVFAMDRYGKLDPNFGKNGYFVFASPSVISSAGVALFVRNDALYVAGSGLGLNDETRLWIQVKLGIDRIFADDFEDALNESEGG